MALLQTAVYKRLTLLSAPPGYGKTTLLADLVEQTNLPYAWYQLDAADGDPTIFLDYLIACMRNIEAVMYAHESPSLGRPVANLLAEGEPVSPERVLFLFINETAQHLKGDYLLVLEDYHLVTNPEVHTLVNLLVENCPPGMHLVISSRTDPPLGLGRLRARGLLAEFRAPDLRFHLSEVQAWLEKVIQDTATETAHLLNEKTEGWAAALQIVLSSLTGKDAYSAEQFISELSGTQRFIFEYLAEEVLQKNPPHVQRFLTHTAVLDQMNAAACDALLHSQDAQITLDNLEKNNLFIISLDEKQEWYRYHHLFREFLVGKLRREAPDEMTKLEQRAGAYYKNQGELDAAFSHFVRANNFEAAANVLASFARDYVERGHIAVLQRYLGELPETAMQHNPELLLQHGNVLWRQGQVGMAVSRYQDAKDAFAECDDRSGIGRVLTQMAELARSQGDYRHAQILAHEALQQLPKQDHAGRAGALMALAKSEGFLTGMDRGRTLAEEAAVEARLAGESLSSRVRANLLRSLGRICWWHGDPQATLRYCQEALGFITDEQSPIAAYSYITMATPYVYRRDLDTAQRYAEMGLGIAQTLQLSDLLPRAHSTLGSVLTRRGNWEQGETHLRQALELAQDSGLESYARVMAVGFLAQNLCGQGRVDEARQLAEAALWERAANSDTYEMVVCRSILADIALESNQLDEAQTIFESLMEIGQRRQFRIPLAMVYFGLAYINLQHGNRKDAVRYGRQSVSILEPLGTWQLFLDQGERARLVCQALQETGQATPFTNEVLRRLPGQSEIVVKETEPIVHVRCFGRFRVFVDGDEVTQAQWVSAKARDMLAYFVNFRDKRIPMERAADAVWPDSDGHGRAFHSALYRLRQALRQGGEKTKFIQVRGGEYFLDRSYFKIDVDSFDSSLVNAHTTHGIESIRWYEHALAIVEGEYLNNLLYYDWVIPERRRLQAAYLDALSKLAGCYASQGQFDHAILLLDKSIQMDTLNEDSYCDAMRYHAEQGDVAALVQQYQRLEDVLRNELNVQPSTTSQQLYKHLLSQLKRD
jgi:LuxR family maltose regulon positive regulatory protein